MMLDPLIQKLMEEEALRSQEEVEAYINFLEKCNGVIYDRYLKHFGLPLEGNIQEKQMRLQEYFAAETDRLLNVDIPAIKEDIDRFLNELDFSKPEPKTLRTPCPEDPTGMLSNEEYAEAFLKLYCPKRVKEPAPLRVKLKTFNPTTQKNGQPHRTNKSKPNFWQRVLLAG